MSFHFLDSFIEYMKDGLKHMRVKFYIQGSEPGKQGTVHLEVKEVSRVGESRTRTLGTCRGESTALMLFRLCFCFFPEPRKW